MIYKHFKINNMKKTVSITLLLFVVGITTVSAQNTSCGELAQFVSKNYNRKDEVNPITSTMIKKAIWYEYDNNGFVIAYIKENDYDWNGNPYIFCGVSYDRWWKFKSEGIYDSYGKAFHKYIMNYTCN